MKRFCMAIFQHKEASNGAARVRARRNSPRTTSNPLKWLRWRLEVLIYVMFESILVLLSAETVARWGAAVGKLGWRIMKSRRRIVRRNLRIAFAGKKTLAEIDAMAREVFQRTGANLLSAVRSSRVGEDELRRTITFVNREVLEALGTNGGRGAVVVLPHMGNWEALSQMVPGVMPRGHRLGSIYRYIKNPVLDRRITAARTRMGMTLFEKHSGPLEMMSFVRSGGCFAVLADQRVDGAGEIVPFFGRLTSCTPLPSMMARRTGAVIMGASVRTLAPGRWAVKLHTLRTPDVTTSACMRLLEETILESPEDVFWFQDRWRPRSCAPATIAGHQPRDAASVAWTKPRRALAWLDAGGPADLRLPESPFGDIAWEYALPQGCDAAWLPKNSRIHFYDAKAPSRRALEMELVRIDESETLPLEFVFTPGKKQSMTDAAKILRLPVQVREAEPKQAS